MATRRPGRGSSGQGIKGGIITALTIMVLIGFIVAWIQANNIKDFSGVLTYFRTWSSQIQACGIEKLQWTCNGPIAGYDGTKKPGSNTPGSDPASAPAGGEKVSSTAATSTLAAVPVASAKDVPYVRSEWKHWSDLNNTGCNTREDILVRTGSNVKTDPKTCKVLSGTWTEPYSNKTFTDSSKLDIDHVVPLSWAASNGGQSLSSGAKEQFANDPLNLYISSDTENRSKGDSGPSKYLPPNNSFQCQYVTSFVTVVAKYKLTIPQADADAARKVLSTKC